MTDLYNTTDREPERAFLAGIDTGEYDAERSMNELEQLALSAGAEVVGSVIQSRETADGALFLGLGKLGDVRDLCLRYGADLLIFDAELTPSQQRNIEDFTGVHTIDRTTLILDIFALHARTGEGKLQVELAQLKYMLPRLGGMGTAMSRLGGGIGTRGPGESKLESDRRHIHRRIEALEQRLGKLKKQRALIHDRRSKNSVTTVAIVGYTNAGKSTLMNALTDAGVLTENKLFATLDPTARALKLPDGRQVLLIDTVGFISRLPHELVEAFKSTLEEVVYADLILNVCDASDPDFEMHLSVTNALIAQLGAANKPMLTVYNKADLARGLLFFGEGRQSVRISALKGEGLDKLLEMIAEALGNTTRRVKLLFPYSEGRLSSQVRACGLVEKEEFLDNGIYMEAVLDMRFLDSVKEWITE